MNSAHLHLLVTHLPILGTVFGFIVLLIGFFGKSRNTQLAAYALFVISAIGAAIAFATGEPAEEMIEHLPGISENIIEEHEESASATLISCIILGLASLAGIYATLKNLSWSRTIAGLSLVISLAAFGLAARTGNLGGKIRHPEIAGASVAPQQNQGGENNAAGEGKDDDD